MKKGVGFWKTDWFLGLVIVIVVFILGRTELLRSLEYKAYDLGMQMSTRTPSDKIAIIAIDDESIANIGRWPWPRTVHAQMTDLLASAKPKVIADEIFFFEPQRDAGLEYIEKIGELYTGVGSEPTVGGTLSTNADWQKLGATVIEAETALNTDRKLADSFAKAGNVVLPVLFTPGDPQGKPDSELPDYVKKFAVPDPQNIGLPTSLIQYPIEEIGKSSVGIGHLNTTDDGDGGIRRVPMMLGYYSDSYPSFAMAIALKYLNLTPQDVHLERDQVSLGKLHLQTDDHSNMSVFFYKDHEGKPAFQKDSFYDVLSGKIPASKYAGKIIIIGPTAAGLSSDQVTPVSSSMAPVEIVAHEVSSILSEHYFVEPWWGELAQIAFFLLVAAYLIVLLPRLRAKMAAWLTGGILVALLAINFGLLIGPGIWIKLMLCATLLLVGHLGLTTKRFLVTEAGKDKSDLESAESNRMLGLAFQGQGQLDMAFDKFRKCPLDDSVMDNLYNLALDFERKRQFNKAQSVYEYMSSYDPNFKDLANKLSRAKTMSETIILGGSNNRSNASLISADGSNIEKPMLGRYQVEKELGKGAMGVVYLGKDPKIGRVVAIKTMALSQEFEADELQDVKERFFREAETAGRLNHPYIVTIFDAGEEHDLAYIAMEFLKGKDLVPYTKFDALLPLERVVTIHARVAEALAYAHRQSVVHRDIKPANIMYELESDTVKVTDFGIARITDSSKTKTGMVLGTPSYMSPEQLSGQKIDGRSDLFSLAVSLYQMSSGRLPFVGDSMAQLMYKIANEQAPDIRTFSTSIPDALIAVIQKGMAKDIEQRYQTGDEFAAELRAVFGGPVTPVAGVTQILPVAAVAAPAAAAQSTAAHASAAAPASMDATQIMQAPPAAAPAAAPAPAPAPVAAPAAPAAAAAPAAPAAPAIDPDATLVVRAPPKPPAPAAASPAAAEATDPHVKTVINQQPDDPETGGQVDFEL